MIQPSLSDGGLLRPSLCDGHKRNLLKCHPGTGNEEHSNRMGWIGLNTPKCETEAIKHIAAALKLMLRV